MLPGSDFYQIGARAEKGLAWLRIARGLLGQRPPVKFLCPEYKVQGGAWQVRQYYVIIPCACLYIVSLHTHTHSQRLLAASGVVQIRVCILGLTTCAVDFPSQPSSIRSWLAILLQRFSSSLMVNCHLYCTESCWSWTWRWSAITGYVRIILPECNLSRNIWLTSQG